MEWSSIKSVLKDSLSKSRENENSANSVKIEDITALIALTLYQNYAQFENNMPVFLSNKKAWINNYYLDINTPISNEIRHLLFNYLDGLEKNKIKINLNNFLKAIEKDYKNSRLDLYLIAEFIIKNKHNGRLDINPDGDKPSIMELRRIMDDLKFMRKNTSKVFFEQIDELCEIHSVALDRSDLQSFGYIKTSNPKPQINIDLDVFHKFFDLSNHPDKLFLTDDFWKKLKIDYLTVKKFRNNEGKVGSAMPEYSKIFCAYFILALNYDKFEAALKEKFLIFFLLNNTFFHESQIVNTSAALFTSWKEAEGYRLEQLNQGDSHQESEFLKLKDEILSTFPEDFFANLEAHYLEEFFGYIDTSIYSDEENQNAYKKHLQNIILKIPAHLLFELGLRHASADAQESEESKNKSKSILYAAGMAIGVKEGIEAQSVKSQIEKLLYEKDFKKAFKDGLMVSWMEDNQFDYLENLGS